jgi:hypothetical protein
VGADYIIEQGVGERRHQKQKRHGRGDGRATRSAECAHPKRTPAPVRGRAFPIQCTQDLGAKRRRSACIRRVATQQGTNLFEILYQRTALGAMFEVAFDISGAQRIDLAVEIRLYT